MSKIIDISPYLIHKFEATFRNGNWRFNCPFCDDEKERLGISASKGVAHCFKCDYKGSSLKFIADVERVSIGQVFKILLNYPSGTRPEIKETGPSGRRFIANIPGYVSLSEIKYKSPTASLATSYLKRRNLGREDIRFWKLGISKAEGYEGRIVIPFFEKGKITYFVARKFIGGGPPYMNPSKVLFGVGKSEVVYNIDNARKFHEIIICEGVFDVMAMEKNCVAIMGKSISQIQIRKILNTKCSNVSILLDSDANVETYKMAHLFSEAIPTFILKLEKGDPASSQVSLSSIPRKEFKLADMLEAEIQARS